MTATAPWSTRRDLTRRSDRGRWRRHAWRGARRLTGWSLVVTVAWLLLPLQYGGSLGTTVVSGQSMEPTFWTGDLVVTWRTGDYEVGDAVVYQVPEGEPGEGLHVVHRVVEQTDQGFVMLGDNNDEPDLWTPTSDDVLGEVVLHVPEGGRWMRLLLSPLALALLCGVLVTLAVVSGGRDEDEDNDSDHDGDGDAAPPDPPAPDQVRPQVRRRLQPVPAPRRSPREPDRTRPALLRSPWARTTLVAVAAAGVVLPVVGAAGPGASASSLGGLRSADLTATRIEQRPATGTADFATDRTLTSDQPTSYCAEVRVTNTGTAPADWEVTLDMASAPYAASAITQSSNVTTVTFVPSTSWTVRGVGWNSTLAPGASTQFQYCADRPAGNPTEVTASVSVTSSNATSYCAEVTVSTTSPSWVRWQATIGRTTPGLTPVQWLDAQPTHTWNVTSVGFTPATQSWVVRGAGWNDQVRAGTPRTWGYCSPYSQSAPLTNADVSVQTQVDRPGQSPHTPYCATVTVSTTSTSWVRWRATVGSATPGLGEQRFQLAEQPGTLEDAQQLSFSGGPTWSLSVHGSSANAFIKAGSPTTWRYCR
jgi:signal peptidase I